jgi:tetratricopeptide (TPR) repeat protein
MAKRKDSAEDSIVAVEEALGKTELFFEKNKNLLTYIVLGIVVVIGGFLLYRNYVIEPKEREAHSQMYGAESFFAMDSFNLAINGDGNLRGFQDIVDEYGGTKAGNLAKYYLGISYLHTGNYDEAIKYLKKFKSKDHIISSMALGAIGDAYMELDDKESAYSYYLKAADKNNNDFGTPLFLMKAGATAEILGNFNNAIKAYERIKKEHHKSNEARIIDKYIARAKGLGEIK